MRLPWQSSRTNLRLEVHPVGPYFQQLTTPSPHQHRDLHWGNVVVAPVASDAQDSPQVQAGLVEQLRNPIQSGVKATIIDYTLSRATIGKTLIAYSFDDESLFEGKGECGCTCHLCLPSSKSCRLPRFSFR